MPAVPARSTYANTPLRSMSWLSLTEYGHIRFGDLGIVGDVGCRPGWLLYANDVMRLRLLGIGVVGRRRARRDRAGRRTSRTRPSGRARSSAVVVSCSTSRVVVVRQQLRRVRDDVEVAAEDEVDALVRRACAFGSSTCDGRQALVVVEAEVADSTTTRSHDRAQQRDVLLERRRGVDRAEAERVAALDSSTAACPGCPCRSRRP